MEEERGLSTVAFLKETFEKHPLLSNSGIRLKF